MSQDAADPVPPGTERVPDRVEARVHDLETALSALIDHVGELTQQVAGVVAEEPGTPTKDGEKNKPAPWLHAPPPQGDTLADWVEWFQSRYAVKPGDRFPACWAQHPGLVAELHTLWACWKESFLNGRTSSCEAAQNWHDRWLPGVMNRRDRWIMKSCMDGDHEATYTRQ